MEQLGEGRDVESRNRTQSTFSGNYINEIARSYFLGLSAYNFSVSQLFAETVNNFKISVV